MRIIKEKKIVDPDAKVDFFSMAVSSGFFVGYAPKASGTFGSLAALLIYAFVPGFNNPLVLLIAIILAVGLGIKTSDNMVRRYGEDPSVVVIDEFAGMWITLLFINFHLSLLAGLYYAGALAMAFLMFRFFDILKIQPAKFLEDRFNNGYGVMLDDVVSGIYAGAASYIIVDYLIYFLVN